MQEALDFDVTGERREQNTLINDIRRDVEQVAARRQYGGVTPITRKLLQHWADPNRENRVLFGQREAAETAIFLTEVAGRHTGTPTGAGGSSPRTTAHNDGLPRVGLKMATGSGKTVVMAMLIAWQTLNKVQSPRDARFANRFLVVTPGHHDPRPAPGAAARATPRTTTTCATSSRPTSRAASSTRAIVDHELPRLPAQDAKEIKGVAKNTRSSC